MRRTSIRVTAVLAFVLAVVLWALLRRGDADGGESKHSSPPGSHLSRTGEADQEARSSPRSRAPTEALASKREQLADLKKRWLRIGEPLVPGDHNNDDLEYRMQLSRESARLLLCSEEAVELLEFLNKEGIFNNVEGAIKNLFGSDLAREARQSLVALPEVPSSDGSYYRQLWSGPAGKGCPPGEFAEFCSALESTACVQEAVFGQNVMVAKTDPVGALTSTLDQISKGEASPNKSSSVKSLLQELPPETGFEEIYHLLPSGEAKDDSSPFLGVKSTFLRAWSKADPAGAVNFIVAHPKEFSVADISKPVMEVMAKDPKVGLAWIETFPRGPYFDSAAQIGISHLVDAGNPSEAQRLASLISDPEARRSLMESVWKPREKLTESE